MYKMNHDWHIEHGDKVPNDVAESLPSINHIR
jgi:hypothetical protein